MPNKKTTSKKTTSRRIQVARKKVVVSKTAQAVEKPPTEVNDQPRMVTEAVSDTPITSPSVGDSISPVPQQDALENAVAKVPQAPGVGEAAAQSVPPDTAPPISEQSTPPPSPEPATVEVEEVPRGKRVIWIIVLVFFLLGVGFGVAAVYVVGSINFSRTPTISESPKPTLAASASPKASASAALDRSKLKIQVLNGSGVKGAAADAQAFLEALGYADIDVGNADRSDYVLTEISIKADKRDYLDLLIDDLKTSYSIASESEELGEESEYDVVIVIGVE